MEKKRWKVSLFIALIFVFVLTSTLPVEAKSKVKLKKSKITITVGQSRELRVVGTKKKIRWTSSNIKIATVNKKGKIKAKKKGNCKIYARVGKKKLVCKVTVKGKSKSGTQNKKKENNKTVTAKNNVTYRSYGTNHGVVILVKNNHSYTVRVDVDCVFYDSKGNMVEKSSDYNSALEAGRECALFAWISHSNWSSYKINLKTETANSVVTNANGINVTYNVGNQNVMLRVKNNGRKNEFTQIAIVYYKDNRVVGYEEQYAHVENSGSSDYLEFPFPYDWDYNTIVPDRYVVYVNNSYTYSWMN